jgi:hypothetical protein
VRFDPGDHADVLHLVDSHPWRPKVYFFAVAFSFPFAAAIAYVGVSYLSPNPGHVELWFWGVIIAMCVGFGILAAIGSSSDIAREIYANERGVRVCFEGKERFYEWYDIRPTGLVPPGNVRFSYSGGFQPFFASPEMTRELVAFQFSPNWSLPEEVKRKLDRLGDRTG